MSVFVDTSALYALLVGTEQGHAEVAEAFERAAGRGRKLLTSSYVVVETTALLQHRIGMPAVRDLHLRILPLLEVEQVSAGLHRKAVERLLREDRRRLSLVDCASFELMSSRGIAEALTLDEHFQQAGFERI
ncbi:MAG: PIN domain-containing protein [Polyangia bacterium]